MAKGHRSIANQCYKADIMSCSGSFVKLSAKVNNYKHVKNKRMQVRFLVQERHSFHVSMIGNFHD